MGSTEDNSAETSRRTAARAFLLSCALGLLNGLGIFTLWAASFSAIDTSVGWFPYTIAIGASLAVGILITLLHIRLEVARRQEPAGLQLFHRLTRDLPGMLYQFRQYPTGRSSVTHCSEAIRAIYELSPEEVRKNGALILDLVHPDDRTRIWHSLVDSFRDLTPWFEEYRVTLPKAGTVWRSAHARVERLPDGGTLWHGFVIDVTEQKRAAAELTEQRERAEKADRAKSEFLAMMSHDIRTPMNAVLGFADLLGGTNLTYDQRSYLSAIRTSGENLLVLINEILDLSRVESGKLELHEMSFPVANWLRDLARILQVRADSKNVAFHYLIDHDAPATIHADRTRLSQILQNIIENAIKFTDNGSVTLYVSAQRADQENRVRWTFCVEDTGTGIPQEKIDKLFDAFNQAGDSDTARQGGVGLGLAIARKICQKMGGDISVQSRVGSGTTMTVTIDTELPLTAASTDDSEAASQVGPVPEAEIAFENLRVLVVEDNLLNSRLVVLLLEKLGCQCRTARDGVEAVAACRTHSFDLVLMDVQMPNLDGPGATRELRALEREGLLASPAGHLPIIALTANALPEQRASYVAAGMDDTLTKPIRRPALIHVLEAASRRSTTDTSSSLMDSPESARR